jgi:plastocyanin
MVVMTTRTVVLAALALLAGCGEGSGPTGQTGPKAFRQAAGQPPRMVTVDAGDFYFEPAPVEIRAGGEVTWENEGDTIHNVDGPGFFSEAIDPNDAWSRVFERPGTYDYLCTLHPELMDGTVVVTGSRG